MAKRKSGAVEAIEPPAQEAAPPAAVALAAERAPADRERPRLPDVSEQKQVLISPGPDGARLRLLRSRRYNQMQISADGELPDKVKEQLHAAGWRDRTEVEGIWTRQLPPRARPDAEGQEPAKPAWPTVLEAERFFEKLANEMRADRGMPPVRLGTAAGAER
jgi:hypothetical protein